MRRRCHKTCVKYSKIYKCSNVPVRVFNFGGQGVQFGAEYKSFHFKHIQNRKEKTRFISCHFDENNNCVTNRKKYSSRMFKKWDNTVLLDEENGDEIEYVFLDLIEYEDEKYIVLLPVEDFDDLGEVVILRSAESDDDENESYTSVEEEVTTVVFGIFKEKHKSEFNIEN